MADELNIEIAYDVIAYFHRQIAYLAIHAYLQPEGQDSPLVDL